VILVVDAELSFFFFTNIPYILGQYNNLIHVNISIAAAEALTVVIQIMKTMVVSVTFFPTSLQVFGH
jgi:hypothetical protein